MIVPTTEQTNIYDAIRDAKPGEWVAVNAVAGSGKTTTGVESAAHAAPGGPAGFFCFNKSVAEHLSIKFVGSGVQTRTFHSVGYDLVRRRGSRPVKVVSDKIRKITWNLTDKDDSWGAITDDQSEAVDAIARLVDMIRLACLDPTDLDGITATAETYQLDPEEAYIALAMQVLRTGIDLYHKRGQIDYADMIWLPEALDMQPAGTLAWIGIDEAQDLSEAQIRLMRRISDDRTRGIILGDRHQAIQGFAFAAWDSWDQVAAKVPQKSVVELPLTTCWRCPTSHLTLAQRLVPHIAPRPGAPTGTVDRRGLETLSTWARTIGRGSLIVSRYNKYLIAAALRMIADGVPAKIKGQDIGKGLQRKVKKIEDKYCPTDLDGFRNATVGYYAKEIDKANKRHASHVTLTRLETERDCLLTIADNVPRTTGVRGIYDWIEDLFGDRGREGTVWLSSIHRAKGLEADTVAIINPDALGAGHLNPKRATPQNCAQEDNLEYVALTRSKDSLIFFQ